MDLSGFQESPDARPNSGKFGYNAVALFGCPPIEENTLARKHQKAEKAKMKKQWNSVLAKGESREGHARLT